MAKSTITTPTTGCPCPEGYTQNAQGDCVKTVTQNAIFPDQPLFVGNIIDVNPQRGLVSYGTLNNYTWPLLTAPQYETFLAYGSGNPPVYPLPGSYQDLRAKYPLTPIPNSGSNAITGDSWTSINPPAQLPGPAFGTLVPANPGGGHALIATTVPSLPAYYTGAPGPVTIPSNNNNLPMYQSNISAGTLLYGQGPIVPPTNYIAASPATNPWKDYCGDMGVWQDTASIENRWAGFIICVEPTVETAYQIIINCNNGTRIFVDNNLAVEVANGDGSMALIYVLHFEIILPPGKHALRIECLNYIGNGALSCDVLNCTQAQLFSVGPNPAGTTAATNPTLNLYRVWSSFWKRSRPMTIAANGTDTITVSGPGVSTKPYDIGAYFDASGFPLTAKVIQVLGTNSYKLNQVVPPGPGPGGTYPTPSKLRFLYDVGSVSGNSFSCPDGYTLDSCNGLNCIQVQTIENVCNLLLTPCCGEGEPIIITPQGGLSYLNDGQVVCIENIEGAENGCWTISVTDQPANYTLPITVGDLSNSCEVCVDVGCKDCPKPAYFVLKDCCTNEVFTIPEKAPGGINVPYTLVFVYEGEFSNDNSPSNLSELGITHFVSQDSRLSYYGCWYLEEIQDIPELDIPLDWNTTMYTVDTVATCEECSCCNPKYKLTNCEDSDDSFIAEGELEQYVTGVVNITDCPDVCYIVEKAVECSPCEAKVDVVKGYIPEGGYLNYCYYNYNEILAGAGGGATLSIVYNGTTYTAPFSVSPFITVNNLNNLDIGIFGINEYAELYVIGSGEYGQLCLDKGLDGKDCIQPTCKSNLTKQCKYGPIIPGSTGSGYLNINIDNFVYISSFLNLTGPTAFANLTGWLNTLNLGEFIISLISGSAYLVVIGDNNYNSLVLPGTPDPLTFVPECNEIEPPCDKCLPAPAPALPKALIQRFIKPGYTTPGCDTEYTEKVNCNYSDQFYQIMLKERYGITICCDPNLEYWEIKKALLDFKADTPKTEDLVPPVICYCYTIDVTAGEINFKYISCEGDCTIVPVKEGESIKVCSQSYPYPICSDSTTITGYTITASDIECETAEDCVPPPPPPVPCFCYYIAGSSPITIQYTDCTSLVVTETFQDGTNIYLCTQEDTISIVEGTVKILEKKGSCEETNDCLPCTCYILKSITDAATNILYVDCNSELITLTLEGRKGIYLCARQIVTSLPRTIESVKLPTIDCNEQCIGNCGCFQVFANADLNMTYLDCENTVQSIFIPSQETVKLCGKRNSITVRSLASPVITELGGCPCPTDCFCYQIRALSTGSVIYKNCNGSNVFYDVLFPQITTICAQQDSIEVTGDISVIPSQTLCTQSEPCPSDCNCYDILIFSDAGEAVITYYRCSDGALVNEVFTTGYQRLCSKLPPTSESQILISAGGTCGNNLDCPIACVCYKVDNSNPTAVEISYTDCNDNIVDVIIEPGIGYLYCIKQYTPVQNVFFEAQSFCDGTSACETVPCPQGCCCYEIVVNGDGGSAIVGFTDCAGIQVASFYPNGTYYRCASVAPTISNNEGTVTLLGNCVDSPQCNA